MYCLIGQDQNWARLLLIGSLNSQDMIYFMITIGSFKLIGYLNSQNIISFIITTGSLNSQNMIWILKQLKHNFPVKHLCWRILYGFYVRFMCGGQNLWLCKPSSRICYIILFECKGPWMLKNSVNCHLRNRGLQN